VRGGRANFVPGLAALFALLGEGRRRELFWLFPLMLLGALAEILTIGSVLPLLALTVRTDAGGRFSQVLGLLGDAPGPALVARAVVLVIAIALVSAAVRLTILSRIQRFSMETGRQIGARIFAGALRQSYAAFVESDPNAVLASMDKIHMVIFGVVLPVMQGWLAVVVAVCVMGLLALIEPIFAVLIIGSSLAAYAVLATVGRRRLRANARGIAEASTARMRALQDGLGNIRDIKLDRSYAVFERQFDRADTHFRRAQADSAFVASAPRYLIEAFGIAALGLLALYLSRQNGGQGGGMAQALPVIGALALGAQRLFPLFQTIYAGWSQGSAHAEALAHVVELLRREAAEEGEASGPAPSGDIVLNGVGFLHRGDVRVLSDISLTIPAGGRVGLSGPSGSGKSTLIDLVMGLLEPSEGEIRIGGQALSSANRRAWQATIAHVPQSIYLMDDTVAANIAFGEDAAALDMDRVREAARLAQAQDFIDAMDGGYGARVGSRGARLSGGQRQRIAIARALYKRARVLVLDEATGQLDAQTEKAVLDAVAALPRDITVIVVAHGQAALALCDTVFHLRAGRLADQVRGGFGER
jgi:ATP-binding cassette subfamily B protein